MKASCGAKNDCGDICGETYRCSNCCQWDRIDDLERRLEAAEGVIDLLASYIERLVLTDPDAKHELYITLARMDPPQ